MDDKNILDHIEELISEEQRLYSENNLGNDEKEKLKNLEIELDQYWDLLRQRRALRNVGKNPDQANLWDPGTVENYEQ